MNLDDKIVSVGARVYDICPDKGHGKVIKVAETYFEVKFQRKTVRYTDGGHQSRANVRSLYWNPPYIVNFTGTRARAKAQREFIDAAVALSSIAANEVLKDGE